MASKYFSLPSFARSKQDTEDTAQQPSSDEPILKAADEKILEEHVANDAPPSGLENVTATKITDDGEEKQTSMQEQLDADHPTDQAVIPETQPETDESTQNIPEQSYDEIMRQKAGERVKARQAKRRTLELPSQEEAEAATRGGNAQLAATEDEERPQGDKRTWTTFLQSMLPNTSSITKLTDSDGNAQSLQAWKEYASSYIPPIPPSWRPSSRDKSKDSRPASPVYNEDGTVNQDATREREQREVSALLDKLSLSEMNNRVFAFSGETQKIYERFIQVLKDTMNGAPTAYEDMERLMREAGPRLEQQFKAMPPFVQTLVKSLPAKIGGTLGPELLAVAGEKPGADLKARMEASSAGVDVSDKADAKKKQKKKRRIPGLKTLLSKEGAVASMLRNVVTFLQTRFPFLASTTSVAMSLAVFSEFHPMRMLTGIANKCAVLMFVFWYCHKRGKEVRLARQVEETEGAGADGEEDYTAEEDDGEEEEEEREGAKEEDEQYQAMLKDVEAKANALNQPDPREVPLPDEKATS